MGSDTASAVSAVWRLESARLVAALARMTHDLGLAEDLAQDALLAALEQWPSQGVPRNAGALLMAVAKRRAVDHIEDDVLRLIFITCHPALPAESRAALTLRLVGGLTTQEIARGFLVKDATIGQRISRAKRTLVGADFDLPVGREREARLADLCRRSWRSRPPGRAPGPRRTVGRCCWRPRTDGCGTRVLISRGSTRSAARRSSAAPSAGSAPSAVVEVNRAVAHGRAFGADAGLRVLDGLGRQALPRSPAAGEGRGKFLNRSVEKCERRTTHARTDHPRRHR